MSRAVPTRRRLARELSTIAFSGPEMMRLYLSSIAFMLTAAKSAATTHKAPSMASCDRDLKRMGQFLIRMETSSEGYYFLIVRAKARYSPQERCSHFVNNG